MRQNSSALARTGEQESGPLFLKADFDLQNTRSGRLTRVPERLKSERIRHHTLHTPELSVTMSSNAVRETLHFNGLYIGSFHDGLSFAEVRKMFVLICLITTNPQAFI